MPRGKAKASTAAAQLAETLSPTTSALAAILDSAQHNYATHASCRRKAESILTTDPTAFLHSLTSLTSHSLTAWHKHAPTERTLAFIASLASALSTPHLRSVYFQHLLSYLLPLFHCSDKAVRLRSVQLVGLMLREREKRDDGLSEETYQQVRLAMMERAEDKQPAVRAAACAALEMMQEGTEEEDDIQEVPETPEDDEDDDEEDEEDEIGEQQRQQLTDEQKAAKLEQAQQAARDDDRQRYPTCYFLLDIAASDSSPIVRRAALIALHIPSPLVRSLFLARLHDSSAAIRRLMYAEVGRRLQWDELTVEDRAAIVEGLSEAESDAGVRRACAELVKQWVKQHDGDLVRLLGKLYVEVYPKQADVLVGYIMDNGWPANDVGRQTPLPPYSPQQLSAESALYWAAMCCHAASSSSTPMSLDALLPSVSELCQAVEVHESNPAVLRQLLAITRLLPLRDESDRLQLREWMQRLLRVVSEGQSVSELDMDARESAVLDVTRVLRRTCAGDEQLFVSSIHDTVTQLSRAGAEGNAVVDIFSSEYEELVDAAAARQQQLTDELLTLQAEMQQLKELGQRESVSRLKQQMRQIQHELAEFTASSQQFVTNWLYHMQAVLVVSATLSLLSTPLPPTLEQLYLGSILVPATELALPGVVRVALRALGRHCLLSREWAVRMLPSFAQMLQRAAAVDEVREEVVVVMQAMTDVMIVHRDLPSEWSQEELNELTACMFAHCSEYRDVNEQYTDRQAALHLTSLECVCKLLLYDCLPPSSATALALLRDLFLRPTNQRLTAPQCKVPAFTRMAADSLRIVGGFLSLYARSDRPGSQYPHSSALLSALMLGMRYIAYAEDDNGQREERLHPPLRQVAEGWIVNIIQHVAHMDSTPAYARQQASDDVQAMVAEEAVAYISAFPHTRCLRALLAVIEQTQPRKSQSSWLTQRLQQAAQAASDSSVHPLVERVVRRWTEARVEEAEAGWEARQAVWDKRLDDRRDEWVRLDVEYGRYERSHKEQRSFDQPSRSRRANRNRVESSDEEEEVSEAEDEDVADDSEQATTKSGNSRQHQQSRFGKQAEQPASRRPVRQSRTVAEERMAQERVRQKVQDALIEADEKAGPKQKQSKQSVRQIKVDEAEDEAEDEVEEEVEVEDESSGTDKENSGRAANYPTAVSSLSSLPIKMKREQQ